MNIAHPQDEITLFCDGGFVYRGVVLTEDEAFIVVEDARRGRTTVAKRTIRTVLEGVDR